MHPIIYAEKYHRNQEYEQASMKIPLFKIGACYIGYMCQNKGKELQPRYK